MNQIVFRPNIYRFSTCSEFAEAFQPTAEDLILTNRYIYEPHFGNLQLPAQVLYQENYGTGEPSDVMTEEIIRDAGLWGCKRIFAIGGGTVIDIAKVLAVADSADVDSLYDKAPDLERRRSLIIIPTTCGTGSEVTNIAVLNRTRMGVKMGLVSQSMYATDAILLPELLEGLPLKVFAASSIDALVHAVESSLSPRATPYTKLFGYRAIEMILGGYLKIASEGPAARIPLLDDFLTASNFAGLAFGTAGCAAVHAMSYPLGSAYHVAHGESNYAMFTGVLTQYRKKSKGGELAVMDQFLAGLLQCSTRDVYERLDELLGSILPKKALHEYGVTEKGLVSFTKNVMETQCRLMKNNFVPLNEADVYQIYHSLY